MKKVILLLFIILPTAYTGFAQREKMKTKEVKTDASFQKTYTCPMHPEVLSNKPGKCPKCGMSLIEKKIYTCPMHPDVVSDKPGTCPKCGMELIEKTATAKSKKSKTKKV